MTDSSWQGTDSEDGFPDRGHIQPREDGRLGCPWLLLLVGVLVVGLGRLLWALVAWGGAA